MAYKLEINNFPVCREQLTPKQKKQVRLCAETMDMDIAEGANPDTAFNHLRLKLFLYFAGLKVLKRPPVVENGEKYYFFRRKGFSHLFDAIPLSTSTMTQLITDNLGWLDKPTLIAIVK